MEKNAPTESAARTTEVSTSVCHSTHGRSTTVQLNGRKHAWCLPVKSAWNVARSSFLEAWYCSMHAVQRSICDPIWSQKSFTAACSGTNSSTGSIFDTKCVCGKITQDNHAVENAGLVARSTSYLTAPPMGWILQQQVADPSNLIIVHGSSEHVCRPRQLLQHVHTNEHAHGRLSRCVLSPK